jgi:hypothetical protein
MKGFLPATWSGIASHSGTDMAGKGLALVPVEVELDWNRAPLAAKPAQAALAPSGGVPEAPPVS